jgi:pimeloyl-ACP methyl ester carboxylesterase
MSTTADMRAVTVDGQILRVAVRPARRRSQNVPLLLINGIGASLELLEPFVAELDRAIEVIRFDVPGVGGSPLPAAPYRFTGLSRLIPVLPTRITRSISGTNGEPACRRPAEALESNPGSVGIVAAIAQEVSACGSIPYDRAPGRRAGSDREAVLSLPRPRAADGARPRPYGRRL